MLPLPKYTDSERTILSASRCIGLSTGNPGTTRWNVTMGIANVASPPNQCARDSCDHSSPHQTVEIVAAAKQEVVV